MAKLSKWQKYRHGDVLDLNYSHSHYPFFLDIEDFAQAKIGLGSKIMVGN